MPAIYGDLLRDWRARRRMSQLDLGLVANVSSKHVAFLETGRSAPSRAMVLQLAEALEAPRAARNAMLDAAGYAPIYRNRPLSDADMAPVRHAIAALLERHEPFPAVALDRTWTLSMANAAAEAMFAAFGLRIGESMLKALGDWDRMAAQIENWPEVARYMLTRLRTESAHLGGDPTLDAAADALAARLEPPSETASELAKPLVSMRFRLGETRLALFSVIAQFGSAEDIALADMKIELMFPADDRTRSVFEAQALRPATGAPERTRGGAL